MTDIFDPPEESSPSGCANCNHPVIQPGYPTPLCESCRSALVKFPVPKGILIFAGIIGLVLVFAMLQVPKNLSAAVHLQRGKKAIENENYSTAEKEFERVQKEMPGYTGVREYLALASFYNQNIDTFLSMATQIAGMKSENEEIYDDLQVIMDKGMNYVPSDSFAAFMNRFPSADSIPEKEYQGYIQQYPDDILAVMKYTSLLFDQEEYKKCDSLLDYILQKDDTYFWALFMKPSIKRQFSQFDSAEYYSNRILALNKESTFGMSAKARTYLQQKRDAEGLKWAQKGYETNPDDHYVWATLALAYHFNNKPDERDKLFEKAKKDSTASHYMTFVHDVIEGREKFREK